jgi:hypothetical protein
MALPAVLEGRETPKTCYKEVEIPTKELLQAMKKPR